jgi:hypothetical protein
MYKPRPEAAKPAPVEPTVKQVDVWETEGGAVAAPTHEQISKRAYEIYLKSGCQEGHCRANWEQAEQELQDEMQRDRAKQGPAARTSDE